MQEITDLYCLTDGVPDIDETDWRRTKASESVIRDPFTGQPTTVPLWTAADPTVGPRASVRGHIQLGADVAWAQAKQVLRAHATTLLDGHIFELCIITVGRELAEELWKPTWIAARSEARLLRFPAELTRWISTATAGERADVAQRWSDQPYLGNAADHDARAVALAFLALLTPLARVACGAEHGLFARTAGGFMSAPA